MTKSRYVFLFVLLFLSVQSQALAGEVTARIKASRVSGVSPLTVVFSAEDTTESTMNEHQIWRELIYHWDFDTDESDTHGALYDQNYTFVPGDTSHEIGGPMVTKTFLCETGTATYKVGVRAQNAAGEFDDAFITITVEAESAAYSPADTVCISNSLDPNDDWTAFDKPCPPGAEKRTTMLNAKDYDGKLILLKKGDTFVQNVASFLGESNFKIGYFGDDDEPRPIIEGVLTIGTPNFQGPSNAPTFATMITRDTDLVGNIWWPENITVEGIKIGRIHLPMSYNHIGFHDVDMDWENNTNPSGFGTISIASSSVFCTDSDGLDCANVPFPKGCYLSRVKIVGSELAETNQVALNINGVGMSMINYMGIVDSQMRRTGEHNIRVQGWWRLNIMRSHIMGEHYSRGKSKMTLRATLDNELFRGQWQTAPDLPADWQTDPEGRTRADAYLYNGTDQYLHLSRYLVIQGNVIGSEFDGAHPAGGKVGTGAVGGDEEMIQDILVTKNTFVHETNQSNHDMDLVGFWTACIDNIFSTNSVACFPTSQPPALNFLRDPAPLNPPSAPVATAD